MKTKEINVLPPEIFNLLAAGEVVENPASIVKETAENSLDAGATEIEIAIEDGGFAEIRVTDDGVGCPESQIEKVFLPHATSKISSAADLERILTLGFRGEALSSIASVSSVVFSSRPQSATAAVKVSLDAGKVLSKTKAGANRGTEIVIRNLFYNVPARRKFLKTMKAEENNVTVAVQKLILSNPNICFKYLVDGEVVYSSAGAGLLSAVETVYGKDISEKLIPVNVNRGELTLSGFISKPDFSKKNRTWQTVCVNGRTVEGGIIGEGANNAFSNYLMTGNFPLFVLDLAIDARKLDVNVHPRKLQVKFEDERGVYNFVKAAVSESIDKSFTDDNVGSIALAAASALSLCNIATVKSASNVLTFLEKAGKFSLSAEQKKLAEEPAEKLNPYYVRKKKREAVQEEIKAPLFDGKILGTVLDTYILAQLGENLYIIDQHAAHERLLFDTLTKQIDEGSVVMQPLLEPAVLVLGVSEMNRVLEIMPTLNQMGIECEIFGKNTFRITAVPVAVSIRGIDTVVSNVLAGLKGAPSGKLSDIVREKIITECCRSAVKAGEHLTDGQVGEFIAQFKGLKIPLCPHGRPVVAVLDRKALEKIFKR